MPKARRRAAFVGSLVSGVILLTAVPAAAHVTVHTDDPVRGASDAAVMFRTPNEMDNAATIKLQVFFPTDHPLLDVLVEPHAGWQSRVKMAKLAQPVTTDDGQLTEAVSEVTWTADSKADGLQPGEADDFVVTAGQLPDTPTVTFRALQTYSNGHVVKWITTQAPGAAEPEFPAPVLTLAPAAASSPEVSAGSVRVSTKDHTARNLAIVALLVAIVAAWLAGAGLVRRR